MSSDPGEGGDTGSRIDVSWTWTARAERPRYRLLRRPGEYPVDPDQGYVVVDSSELFRGPDEPWERVSRVRWLWKEGGTEGAVCGSLAFFHDVPGASTPARVDLELRGPSGDLLCATRIEDVTRIERTMTSHGDLEALEIFHVPDGVLERSAGVVTRAAGSLRWEPGEASPAQVRFDRSTLAQTRSEVRRPSERERLVVWVRSLRVDSSDLGTALADPAHAPAGACLRSAVVELRELSAADGAWTRSVRVSDLTAPPEQTACYTLFVEDLSSPTGWTTERGWKASAGGTTRGFDDPMLGGLPSVQQYVDERRGGNGGSRPGGSWGSRTTGPRR